MLLIETFLKEVPGKGISLFTSKDIKKGEVIYEDCMLFSHCYANALLPEMPKFQQDFIRKYACYVKPHGMWYLDTDNGRFFNHSNNPNTQYDWGTYLDGGKGTMIAQEDIPADTELTSDYRTHSDQYKDGNFDFDIA